MTILQQKHTQLASSEVELISDSRNYNLSRSAVLHKHHEMAYGNHQGTETTNGTVETRIATVIFPIFIDYSLFTNKERPNKKR
jgi:hypothetical protein